MVVALVPPADLDRLARLRRRFGSLTIVQFDRSAWDPSAAAAPAGRGGEALMHIPSGASFADTWNQSVRPSRRTAMSWSAPTTAAAAAAAEAAADDWDSWARPAPRVPRA